jgi:GntR family transcriptional regulator/MocR family aminotransferase
MPISWSISGVDLHLDVPTKHRRFGVEIALRDAVRSGRLTAGTRLPSTRSLASDLGLARNTVAAAYAQLVAEGWLQARPGAGTWVAGPVGHTAAEAPLRAAASRPAPYDLRAGMPDLAEFPRADWLRAMQRALRSAPAEALGYPDPRGRSETRRALAGYLARARGVDADPERLIVCSGFAQGLTIVAAALRAAGISSVAVEEFAHLRQASMLAELGLTTTTVEVDESGARIETLDDAGAVLLTPAHQFPLGATLAPRRRHDVVDWARSTGAVVVEDDYDGEFRYDRQPIGALQALAPDHVIYAGTASKSLAPGLRLAWLVLPPRLVDAAGSARQLTDGPSTLDQLTMAQFVENGAYDRHIRRARLAYRRRRDRLVAALETVLTTPQITGPAAGLHLVVRLPDDMTEEDAVTAARARGLALEGLDGYRLGPRRRPPALVVGYGTPPEHAFAGALDRLVAVLRGSRDIR